MGSKSSVSHQVGMNGVPQIDAGSNLVSILGLSYSAKVVGYTKASHLLWGLHGLLWWDETQRVIRVRPELSDPNRPIFRCVQSGR